MLPTDTLHHRFAAGFRPADGRSGHPFPLNASWPIPPIGGASSSLSYDRESLTVQVKAALRELQRHGLAGTFRIWRERVHYRRELNRLALVAPHMIDDIGLTLHQALAEAHRPFWC